MEREQTTIRTTEKLKKQLQREAKENGLGLNSQILMILNAEKSRQEKLRHGLLQS